MTSTTLPTLPELQFAQVDGPPCGLDGNRMTYRAAGEKDKDAVLLLHGIGTHAGGWRYILDGLSDNYHVIAWDAPGYFLSDNFATDAPDSAQYAAAAVALLDTLDIDTCHVVGSSFGSMVGATLAAIHPKRVRSLALLGASRGQLWRPTEARRTQMKLREDLIAGGGFEMAEKRWRQLLGHNPSDQIVAVLKELLKAINSRAYLQAARASDTTDILQLAGRITAPTQLIVGTEDLINPPAISAEIHGAIAHSMLTHLDGIGHLPKLETPETVIDLLRLHFVAL